jgi:hypothetical protein
MACLYYLYHQQVQFCNCTFSLILTNSQSIFGERRYFDKKDIDAAVRASPVAAVAARPG